MQQKSILAPRRRTDLSVAERELAVWREHTKKKVHAQLQGEINFREASWKVGEAKVALARRRLERAQQEIARCTFKAPVAGQIHYPSRLEPGGKAPPSGAVVHIDDPVQGLFEADVPREAQVTVGMSATVHLDRILGASLKGRPFLRRCPSRSSGVGSKRSSLSAILREAVCVPNACLSSWKALRTPVGPVEPVK